MERHSLSIRPMTVGNILDYTFRIYRNNFFAIFVFTGLIAGLFSVLMLLITQLMAPPWIVTDQWGPIIRALKEGRYEEILTGDIFIQESLYMAETDPYGTMIQMLAMNGVTGLLSLLSAVFIQPFVLGGVISIAHHNFHGTTISFSQSLGFTLKKFWRLVLTGLCMYVSYMVIVIGAIILLLIIVIPLSLLAFPMSAMQGEASAIAVVLISLLFLLFAVFAFVAVISFMGFTYPVVIAEEDFHFRAVGRSIKLVAGKFWRVFGINLLVDALIMVITLALGAVAFAAAYFSPVPSIFQQVYSFLINSFILPISHIASTLLYYDVRMRVEGYDIELMTEAVKVGVV